MKRAVAVAFALAGCGDIAPFECSTDQDCTDAEGVTGTCADPGFCAFSDASCMSGLRYDEQSAGDLAGQCVGPDIGPLGDTADRPRALATFQQIDVSTAHDDYASTCGVQDDVDIFFETTIDHPARLYVDTFGTDFQLLLTIRQGACADNGTELDCLTDVCSTRFQQWSGELGAGTYCVIADRVAGETASTLIVRSMLGPPAPTGIIGTNDGSTCGNDDWQACGSSGAPEQTWFYMSCTPATFTATTCPNDPSFDGDLQAWGLDNAQLACGDGCNGGTGINAQLVDPGPVWIVAEASTAANCGPVSVDIAQ